MPEVVARINDHRELFRLEAVREPRDQAGTADAP